WRVAAARVLSIAQSGDGKVTRLVYGFPDDRGAVRLEVPERAVAEGRLEPAGVPRIYARADAADDVSGMTFAIAYDTRSPAHAYVPIAVHVADALADKASTPRAQAGVARLRTMSM